MISLANSLEPLIELFNSDRDKPRVVAIVSATCGAYVRGAIAVNESVLKAYPFANVSIFVVWIDLNSPKASQMLSCHEDGNLCDTFIGRNIDGDADVDLEDLGQLPAAFRSICGG